jgi:putative nucleotidyltransferase with HDIG domain
MRATSRREIQLDAISSVLILAITAVVGLLLWLMSTNGVVLPPWFPLADYIPRILLGGFVILVVLYLWDQRRRLRAEIDVAWAETQATKNELDATCNWLAFSHKAASKLGAQGVESGMREVLADAAALFEADAAAVLGEEDEYTFIAPGAPVGEAERALTHVALFAAGNAAPLHIQSLGTEAGQAIAVPLRVQGDLRYVLCIWRREADFTTEQLDALGLMGRMVELAIEREDSLSEAQSQLEGTLRVLQYLVADKRPDYSRHAVGVAELSAAIGHKLGLSPQTRKNLRLAGLIHDVGMMSLPQDVGDAGRPLSPEETMLIRQHPRIGAEIAKAANFIDDVQEAVAGHHERMDGSGYPLGLRGNRIPLEARILAVCEVYDSMTHRTYHGVASKPENALDELRRNSGALYDPTVVSALLGVIGESGELQRPSTEQSRVTPQETAVTAGVAV